jgi:putative transcriptional regulator
VILVASPTLDGSPFGQTVLLATPLENGGHIGFILNKPTGVKLDALFPDDTAAHDVVDGAYLGGPAMLNVMFALTRNAPERPDAAIPLMPGLFAVVHKDAIDHIIRTTPNDARYFFGVMVWEPGQLANQVDGELWDVHPANADIVLRARSSGLWNSLRGPWVNLELDRRTAAG